MKKSLFLFLVFLFFSLSFSQNNWIEKTDWKSLESFEKNKQKQLSFILLEGAGELKQVNNRPQPGLEDVLSNFNCTKIKLENQKIQFKNRTFKKNKNENLHEFERFLVGEENTNLLSLKPLIIILDENFNLIEFSFFNKIEKSKEDQNILIEAEKLKLEYLKKQISDTTHKAIVRTEAALKR